jgi:hypothetical protein
MAIYTGAKALSRWPINDESTLTLILAGEGWHSVNSRDRLAIGTVDWGMVNIPGMCIQQRQDREH